jgi:hypothetical protein
MAQTKVFEYTVTYRFPSINFDKAKAKADALDSRAEKAGYTKTGEARLRAREADVDRYDH